MKYRAASSRAPHRKRAAFTLVELLVVITIIAILAGLLLPTLSKAKQKTWTISCLNNLKQLTVCWHLYATENEDTMVPNNFVYVFDPNSGPQTSLGEDDMTWCRSLAPYDTNQITEKTSMLFQYNRTPSLYRCPADKSTVQDQPDVLRNRSYNLNNSANCRKADGYRKYTEVPRPATLFTFIDTHEDAIYDATFGIFAPGSGWQDYWMDIPADRHQQGANSAFVDGHVERTKWLAKKNGTLFFQRAYDDNDLADLRVLQRRIKGQDGN